MYFTEIGKDDYEAFHELANAYPSMYLLHCKGT